MGNWNLRLNNLTARVWPLCAAFKTSSLESGLFAVTPCSNFGNDFTCSTQMSAVAAAAATPAEAQIRGVSLTTLLKALGIGTAERLEHQKVILKLDCEGCEWGLIFSDEWDESIEEVIGELHFTEEANVSTMCKDLEVFLQRFLSLPELCNYLRLCLPAESVLAVNKHLCVAPDRLGAYMDDPDEPYFEISG